MSPTVPDLVVVAKRLEEEGVRYVLVGGIAIMAHGGDRLSFDLDFALALTPQNRSAVVRALRPLHPLPLRATDGAAWEWDEKCVRGPWTLLRTDAGRVDLVLRLPGIDSFEGLYERSQVLDFSGTQVRVASLEDLLAMKEAADRDRDLLDRNTLRALIRLRDEATM